MSRVGSRIREARTKKGVSAKQLAKQLGVAESYISEVETGKKIINEGIIKRIEKILEVSLDEEILVEVAQPVENLKTIERKKVVNEQIEDAFSHILKKLPVCDINFREIYEYKYLPNIDRKIEGYNCEKLIYIRVPDESMRGFRIQKDDRLLVYQNTEVVNNSIVLIEVEGKRSIRQIKRLDSNRILIISQSNDIKTETIDIKALNIIGRCIKLEVDL